MPKSFLAPTDDPKDGRRRRDIKRDFQTKEFEHFTETPDVKQIRDKGVFLLETGGKKYIGIRIGDAIYKVEVV